MVAAALLVNHPTSQPSLSGQHTVALPVVPCKVTVSGSPSPVPTPAVTSETVVLPNGVASRLTFYGIAAGETILAPRGWDCSASIWAVNSEIAIVSLADPQEAVRVYDGGSLEYILALSCQFFPEAMSLWVQDFPNEPCGHPPPAGEVIRPDGPDFVRFTDPPGLMGGLGGISGGPYPVESAAFFSVEPRTGATALNIPPIVASKASCAMAPADMDLCDAIIADWIARSAASSGVPAP